MSLTTTSSSSSPSPFVTAALGLSAPSFHFNFDWADDVEDELHTQQPSGRGLCHSFNDHAPPVSAQEYDGRICDDLTDSAYDTCENSSRSESKITVDDLTCEGGLNEQCFTSTLTTEQAAPLDRLHQGLAAEFWGRQHAVAVDTKIHHFNWLGHPVYQASGTAPTDSLAIILSGPKVPKENDSLRVKSMLKRASAFLDPVVVSLEKSSDSSSHRDFNQTHALRGHVSKFYTAHGTWFTQPSPLDAGLITLDTGSVAIYQSPHRAVGNGFVESSLIPSRADWSDQYQEKQVALGSSPWCRNRQRLTPSSLRQATWPGDPEVMAPEPDLSSAT
ncbi:Uncharacterized protein PECH_002851 [Penicillium ucsense]|uniref:Uncharacterized protein n=1 Tax=Penicillium ucsense TaxID=2839758 RepID=A0A8J8VWK1_9EURO|nr:Uncharacterized protein PECM_002499 [Penicillium ucsense]KAF7730338.1 Uncharacterized protein PECH_002851 [Penicillium ucsense]